MSKKKKRGKVLKMLYNMFLEQTNGIFTSGDSPTAATAKKVPFAGLPVTKAGFRLT
jgi:hypothetical protein